MKTEDVQSKKDEAMLKRLITLWRRLFDTEEEILSVMTDGNKSNDKS